MSRNRLLKRDARHKFHRNGIHAMPDIFYGNPNPQNICFHFPSPFELAH
jgi:hypothetical protein